MAAKKRTKKRVGLWALLLTPLLAAAVVAGIFLYIYFPFNGLWIKRDSREIDLRGYEISCDDYRELKEKLPQCRILWRIPIGNQTFDCTARAITIEDLDAADVELFRLFEDLQEIHAVGLDCYEDLQTMAQQLPGCRIDWKIRLGNREFKPGTKTLDLTGAGADSQELLLELKWLENLEQVEIQDAAFSQSECRALREAYPDTVFIWPLEVEGKTWLNTETKLTYAGESINAQALAEAAGELTAVQELDLTGCGLTTQELLLLRDAYPNAKIQSEISLFGQVFTTDAEKLDLSEIPMEDTQALEEILPLMHSLTWVDMCDCGLSNEVMDDLNKRYEPLRFVWKVHFSVYTLRTDATFFCASDLPENGYVAIKMNDEQLAPLKYCEDLIALDLGHMRYTDLSFLENMPKLQYLILVEARFSDITAIGKLEDLVYLEIFMNTFDDLSPLLNCKNLKHLNIGYTSGFDTSVLKEFTQLERLWFPGNTMTEEEIEELKAALPNTLCHLPEGDPDGSTGNGWREADIYFEMRDIFSMHYMPGGTGMGKDKN